MACFTVPPETVLLGRETIYRNGERVGWLPSGGYGYTVEKSIGYGYVRREAGVDAAYVLDGDYELEVATKRVKCSVSLAPLYDPKMEKVKA
jgi:4-methylaminobutanoate oxidase (formaldehyde-forming)